MEAHNGSPLPNAKKPPSYRIFALTQAADACAVPKEASGYLIESEKYGIPQSRHRVILLGVRDDIAVRPRPLMEFESVVSSWGVIGDLPKLRSGLSREEDNAELWANAVRSITAEKSLHYQDFDERVRGEIISVCNRLSRSMSTGGRFLRSSSEPGVHSEWYVDERLHGVCNHSTRLHRRDDLHRYIFSSCYAAVHRRSPLLKDFPPNLLPRHSNVAHAIESGTRLFSDRFRVQLWDSPATTITSHMAKDGHYFIDPAPAAVQKLYGARGSQTPNIS